MSASKNEVIVERWPEYLALHQQEPRRYPLEVEEYAAHVGMSKVTIYSWAKKDARVQTVLDMIRKGPPAAVAAQPRAPTDEDMADVLDVAAVNRELHDLLRLANNACKHFVAEYQRHHLEDGPLTAWQLEQTARKLLQLAQEVRPKRDAILRHQRREAPFHAQSAPGTATAAPDNVQPSLFTAGPR